MQKDFGFSLIEVMIALFILAFGLLGILSLQTITLKRDHDTYLQNIAITQIASAVEILQLTTKEEVSSWNEANAKLLPQGAGEISADKISVCWLERIAHQKRCLDTN